MDLKQIELQVKWTKGMIVLAILIIPTIYLGWFWGMHDQSFSESAATWGSFGDFIGGILNPVIALLAFYWLVNSVVIQKTELEATKKALEASHEAQQDQARTLAHQRFDTTFFALLAQQNIVLNNLTAVPVGSNFLNDSSNIQYVHYKVFGAATVDEAQVEQERLNSYCGHYFRALYQLLKYVATKCPGTLIGTEFGESDISNNPVTIEEKFYANIVRSFLNYEVTQLLAINCCVSDASDSYFKYKLLVERYSLLEHMPFTIENQDSHSQILEAAARKYKKVAFGNSEFIPEELAAEAWT